VVFVSGPLFSSGNPVKNIAAARRVAVNLIDLGCTPIVPHDMAMWELEESLERDEEREWMTVCYDLLLECSNAIYVLEGESKHGALEVQMAQEINLPILRSEKDVNAFCKKWAHWLGFQRGELRRK
jgi:hypothetical protein